MSESRGKLALITGSGMAGVHRSLDSIERRSFVDIDGMTPCDVEGHLGDVWTCGAGSDGDSAFLVFGRRHFYEGAHQEMGALIRWLAEKGVTDLVAFSAAGSLHRSLPTGELVVADAIVDLQNRVPAPAGARASAAAGTAHRWRGATHRDLYVDRDLSRWVERTAIAAGLACRRGTVACNSGPGYETAAEVGFLQGIGVDVATMSLAPEVEIANRLGLRVAVVGTITNPATGVGRARPRHEDVLHAAQRLSGPLSRVVGALLGGYAGVPLSG